MRKELLTKKTKFYIKLFGFLGFFMSLVFYAGFIKPPLEFPVEHYSVVEEGASVRSVANALENENIIRSSFFFTILVQLFGDSNGVRSGVYHFDTPSHIFQVVTRLNQGVFGEDVFVRVTIPEGATVIDIAVILSETIPDFNVEQFTELAKEHEGYLFPDTYLFAPGASAEAVIAAMRDNFDTKIETISEKISVFGKPLGEVVIMASLLEKEARQFKTMQIVAGILWNRISIGMPLQVDAVFGYIFNTKTFSPTFDQLETDSPYNTYLYTGLPPGPIANPGLAALEAAVTPQDVPYLYYLTGSDGTMHYAETFEKHKANRRFLR
ncbi:MAG: endolytic transglycosylase MltG [Patescibacteria group bacterium UBA2163]